MSSIVAIGAVVAAAGALASAGVGISNSAKSSKQARIEAAKERRMAQRLEAFENARQPVLNQSEEIRAMKNQLSNPYAQMGVAMKATEMKMEETDKALANTLDSIRASGMGAGGASALAQMAATSKAEVAASIEEQELSNQKARLDGEASLLSQKMAIEQAALAENAASWGRQEERDVTKMNRMAGLQDRAGAQSIAYEQASQAALMEGMGAVTDAGMGMVTAGAELPEGYKLFGKKTPTPNV